MMTWTKYNKENIEKLFPFSYYLFVDHESEYFNNVTFCPPIGYNKFLEGVDKLDYLFYDQMEFYIQGDQAFDFNDERQQEVGWYDETYYKSNPFIIRGKKDNVTFYVYFQRYDWVETQSEGCGGEDDFENNRMYIAKSLEDLEKYTGIKIN